MTTAESPSSPSKDRPTAREIAEYRGEAMAVRAIVGGILMGLANLVPGISGGTMLLAVGIYPQFIGGIAEVSTFRFRGRTVLMLICVAVAAAGAIVGLAGLIGALVADHRWVMYSLFIGLTLGGVPILWRMLKPVDSVVVVSSILGIALMAVLAAIDPGSSASDGTAGEAYLALFLAGVAGGSAMILPGVSGAYLLLILGQYLVILTALDHARVAVSEREWTALVDVMHVLVPVGVGVAVGIVGVSNLIKILLARFERATLGVLLGLLLGAVIGLWPFQVGVPPEIGEVIKGVELASQAMIDEVDPADYPTRVFQPSVIQAVGALGLMVVGFLISAGIARLGNGRKAD